MLYLFGDNPEHFDLIYIGALGLSCVFCWADKGILASITTLLGFWCLSRGLYMLPDNLYILTLIYILCIFGATYYISNINAKVTFLIVIFSIGIEIFWIYAEYADKPRISYFVGLLVLTGLTREFLFKKVLLLHKYFNYISGKVALDWHIRWVYLIYYLIVLAMIVEYFLRHLGDMNQLTIIYYSFSPLANILATLTLIIIYMHYFYDQSKKYLKA